MASKSSCYWFIQGKCQLFTMPEEYVYGILSRVPAAREDLADCNTSCPNVDQVFIDFANNPGTLVQPPDVRNEKFMEQVRKYNAYTANIGQAPVILPNHRPKEDDDE